MSDEAKEDKDKSVMPEKEHKANKQNSTAAKDNANKSKSVQKVTSKEKPSPGLGRLLAIAGLMLVIIVIAVFVLAGKGLDKLEQRIAESGQETDTILKEIDSRFGSSSAELRQLQDRINELESKQDILSRSIADSPEQKLDKDYVLAEIEHLLIIATYNLQLDHDIDTALSAMESADRRLLGLNDPGLLDLRKQLIADMASLKSAKRADLSGTGLYLSALIDDVDNLPLKENVVIEQSEGSQSSSTIDAGGIKEFFYLVWQEIKSLVVITRDTEVSKERLLPDEVYFLHANIKLELANARFAVFNRDTKNLHAAIKHIKVWLEDYFDMSDPVVINIYDSLGEMEKLDLEFPALDINSSLESVKAVIRNQQEPDPLNNVNEPATE